LLTMFLLAFANLDSIVHNAIIRNDICVTYSLNSIVGLNDTVDRVIGFLNTKLGDLTVISALGAMFLLHALSAHTLRSKLSRLAFWGWAGALMLTAYVGIWPIEDWIGRPIPLQVLDHLHNGQTMNGMHLHSSANESFPSGHALAFSLFVLISFKRYPRMSLLLALIAAVLLPIRLGLGLHWLSDMALGSLPLACLLTALSYETPIFKSYFLIRKLSRAVLKSNRLSYALYNVRQTVTMHGRF
jgi:membrane-associated phospholipid phosphatase